MDHLLVGCLVGWFILHYLWIYKKKGFFHSYGICLVVMLTIWMVGDMLWGRIKLP